MDYKIKFGLICVVALFMVCRNVQTTTLTPTNGTNATTPADLAKVINSTKAPNPAVTTEGGATLPIHNPTTATPPAEIKCKDGTCNDTTCAALKPTCVSDASRGCQITTDANGDHKFSCVSSGGTCKADDKTKCCATENCNPFEKSSASKVIGNLVSAFLMMVLIKFL